MKLSIIIPTIGRETLDATLNSIRFSHVTVPIEVVLVNDGNHPAAFDLYLKYQRDLEINYLSLDTMHNDFGAHARNMAYRVATGTHFAYMDDDDIYSLGGVETIIADITAQPTKLFLYKCLWFWTGLHVWSTKGDLSRNFQPNKLLNLIGQCFVHPHLKFKYGYWRPEWPHEIYFINETLLHHPPDSLIWREDVIAHIRPTGKEGGY